MPADGHSVRIVGDDVVEVLRIVDDDLFVREDGRVGGDDDLRVLRHVLQIVLQPGQLLLTDLLLVLLPVRLAFVFDAVEDDEVGLADVVGEVRRSELIAEGVEGV